MRQREIVPAVLILLCAMLLILPAIGSHFPALLRSEEDKTPEPAGTSFGLPKLSMGQGAPGLFSGAEAVIVVPPLLMTGVSSSPACDHLHGSDVPYPAEDSVCISSIERLLITDPVRGLTFGIRVWCRNTGKGDARVQVLLTSRGKEIGNASLSLDPEETSAVDFVSPISLSAVPAPIFVHLNRGQAFGAGANPTGSHIGGGEGFFDIITPMDPRVNDTVRNADELLTALESAEEGDVVYIDEAARIDLSDIPGSAVVPGGVTLASNRGARTTAGSAVYTFDLMEPGEYLLWGLVSMPGGDGGSALVSIDGEEPREWKPRPDEEWSWIREGSRTLSAGRHRLTIQWQQEGLQLDRILITDDPDSAPDADPDEHNGEGLISLEAESGLLSPPLEIHVDAGAPGGGCISVSEDFDIRRSPISRGGTIFRNTTEHSAVTIAAGGEGVRITGLRIEGPDTTTDPVERPVHGIFSSYQNLEVDNCEISGWSYSGVYLHGTGGSTMQAGGHIHHNSIHHCQMNGLGYGALVSGGAQALIEANYFDYTRHAVAGSGVTGDGYEVRYNRFGPNHIASSAFQVDMHGQAVNGTNRAGTLMYIHHNTFETIDPWHANPVRIRGIPRDHCYIYNNWFHYSQDAPVWQTGGRGNISMTNNLIGQNRILSESGPIKYY
ncbi:MAG: right-handed parallel beta-helix repeat-containing protein [Methanomicrobiaceae archaeon]|uniref:Right handed beta helix domain-containing protein n=1 Tax=hydrocarbon metagenome TaxID=938273 RepID=A0A0W8FEZ6_9ZZZZ|nr:right-handed parallel beta-helix repeat-containing protein [Methanomicrobiaceae archaeon]